MLSALITGRMFLILASNIFYQNITNVYVVSVSYCIAEIAKEERIQTHLWCKDSFLSICRPNSMHN